MKKVIIFISVSMIYSSRILGQKEDTIANNIIQRSLFIIESYLINNNSDSSLKRVAVISFLTDLTGIPSQSPGGYVGQLSPTQTDLLYWRLWYNENKTNISWDKKSGKIIVRKEITPPDRL